MDHIKISAGFRLHGLNLFYFFFFGTNNFTTSAVMCIEICAIFVCNFIFYFLCASKYVLQFLRRKQTPRHVDLQIWCYYWSPFSVKRVSCVSSVCPRRVTYLTVPFRSRWLYQTRVHTCRGRISVRHVSDINAVQFEEGPLYVDNMRVNEWMSSWFFFVGFSNYFEFN